MKTSLNSLYILCVVNILIFHSIDLIIWIYIDYIDLIGRQTPQIF